VTKDNPIDQSDLKDMTTKYQELFR